MENKFKLCLTFSIIFFFICSKGNAYAKIINADFVSAKGILAECTFENQSLKIILTENGKSKIYNLSQVKSADGARYENSEITFRITGNEATVSTSELKDEKFFQAEKYSGNVPNSSGIAVTSEYFFSDAVTNVYIIKTGNEIQSGKWYLLKGDPPEFDSTYNTTLYELLLPDSKKTYQCFMHSFDNLKKLILLSSDCDIKKQSEYFLLKQDLGN